MNYTQRLCAACGSEFLESLGQEHYQCTRCGSNQVRYEERRMKPFEVVVGTIGALLILAFLVWLFADQMANDTRDPTDWYRK